MEENSQTNFFFFLNFFNFNWIYEGHFQCSHLLMYFLNIFTIIFLNSNLNHKIAILSGICTNIFKFMV